MNMCLAVPGKIIEIQDMLATVDISGVTRKVSIMLLPEARVGEFVLIHAGFAVQTIDEEEARKTLELFKELEQYAEHDK
jgi:hydrogenase expression/formation protein HypC